MPSQLLERCKAELEEYREAVRTDHAEVQANGQFASEPETKVMVEAQITTYRARVTLIDAWLLATDALLDAGYPELEVPHEAELHEALSNTHKGLGDYLKRHMSKADVKEKDPEMPKAEAAKVEVTSGGRK